MEVALIEKLLGGKSAEEVLLYIYAFGEGYGAEISSFSGISLNVIQKQLSKFEDAGLLVSMLRGRTRIFKWNPRYPFLSEFRQFIEKVFLAQSQENIKHYYSQRKRPRKAGKKI